MEWVPIPINSAESPCGRGGASLHLKHGESPSLIVFGGIDRNGNCDSDVWKLRTDTREWMKIPVSKESTLPAPRSGHASCLLKDGRLVVFGGLTVQNGGAYQALLNDCWTFDFETSSWSEISLSGKTIPPRHAVAIARGVDNTLVVYGGSADSGPKSDLYSIDLSTGAVTLWAPENTIARELHSGVNLSDEYALFFGGKGPENELYSTVSVLNTRTGSWVCQFATDHARCGQGLALSAVQMKPEEGGSGSSSTGSSERFPELFVVGGFDGGGLLNDVLKFDMDALTRLVLEGREQSGVNPQQEAILSPCPHISGDVPEPRLALACTGGVLPEALNPVLYIFGGSSQFVDHCDVYALQPHSGPKSKADPVEASSASMSIQGTQIEVVDNEDQPDLPEGEGGQIYLEEI